MQSEIKQSLYNIPYINICINQCKYPFYYDDGSEMPKWHYADQLYFIQPKIITDLKQLFYLFKLFTLIIDELVKMDIAFSDAPPFSLLEINKH